MLGHLAAPRSWHNFPRPLTRLAGQHVLCGWQRGAVEGRLVARAAPTSDVHQELQVNTELAPTLQVSIFWQDQVLYLLVCLRAQSPVLRQPRNCYLAHSRLLRSLTGLHFIYLLARSEVWTRG